MAAIVKEGQGAVQEAERGGARRGIDQRYVYDNCYLCCIREEEMRKFRK